ncbi:MAG: CCA tRNA nucleotidyltransferase [Waddliaceae bacterium]
MTRALKFATQIVEALKDAGYIAYFAGGWVRDFVMGHPSDDIDIATSASPREILELFPGGSHVGIAFGVVVVPIDGIIFEVATFRKDFEYHDGRRPVGFALATPEDDAKRRDFTINGMFYDPISEKIYDFVKGLEDIEKKCIQTIGSPDERFKEDRLRLIRAIRFANRFDFSIAQETWDAICRHAHTLFPAVAVERVWQEWQKMAKGANFEKALLDLDASGLLSEIFPELKGVRIQPIAIPEGSPAIFSVMQLFPDATVEKVEEICLRLKTSTKELKQAKLLMKGRELLTKKNPDLVDLVYFFADPLAEATLAMVEVEYGMAFPHHKLSRENLMPHIQRVIKKSPLIRSSDLMEAGINPGVEMGQLLEKAERIAITQDLHDPKPILNQLFP